MVWRSSMPMRRVCLSRELGRECSIGPESRGGRGRPPTGTYRVRPAEAGRSALRLRAARRHAIRGWSSLGSRFCLRTPPKTWMPRPAAAPTGKGAKLPALPLPGGAAAVGASLFNFPFCSQGPFAVRKWSGGMAMGRKKARLNLPRIAVGSKEGAREEGVRSRCRAASVCGCRPSEGRGKPASEVIVPGRARLARRAVLALLWFDAVGCGLGLRGRLVSRERPSLHKSCSGWSGAARANVAGLSVVRARREFSRAPESR